MKKTFIIMILILTMSITTLMSISINSLTVHGSDGTSDQLISLGETVTVIVDYTTDSGTEDIPISTNLVQIRFIGSTTGPQMVPSGIYISDFSGPLGTNVIESMTFSMPAIPSDEDDFKVLFGIKDAYGINSTGALSTTLLYNAEYSETLPVELSSFDAIATAEDYVNINWTVQSETNISGYFIIRGLQNDIDTALMIPAFINATNGAQEHSYTFTDREVATDNIYFYWLQSVEFSLETELFGPTMVKVGNPTGGEAVPVTLGTQLIGNYPNPFNPSTSISFSVANPGQVSINIFNVRGQLVKNLYNSFVDANKLNQRIDVLWNGRDNDEKEVASGVYYTKMNAGNHSEFKKMLLVK